MDYLPIFLAVKDKPCLVVGGGLVALRKINLLLSAGAQIDCVSLSFSQAIKQLAQVKKITLYPQVLSQNLLEKKTYQLMIVASSDKKANQQAAQLANANHIAVNVVDKKDLCDFIVPSIVERAPLTIAISSAGQAPVLTRLLREKLEGLIPAAYGRLAKLASDYRQRVKAQIKMPERRFFWQQVFSGVVAERVFAGQNDKAAQLLAQQLENYDQHKNIGEVYLVGGGPGDPDLLTFKALRLMQQADVVLYDRLVTDAVVNLVRRDAKRIYVGKSSEQKPMCQQDINQLLIDLAKQGKRVCRLKGGDPFIFGRGGEEIEQLTAHNIAFQVVPGITAAAGCAAYAGIPLTHRDYAQSCRFVTGHLKNGVIDLPWQSFIGAQETLVFYMGLLRAPHIAMELMRHGIRADMPVALIEKGTTKQQNVYVTCLADLSDLMAKKSISTPTLIIVGEVVKLRKKLNWFQGSES